MRYGIIADVHANREALEAVLACLGRQLIDRYLCCGDLVGYGPDPNACVEAVKKLDGLAIVPGNHDLAACKLRDTNAFNEYARKALVWTWQTLELSHQIWLSELPRTYRSFDIMLVHGSPRSPIDEYMFSVDHYEINRPLLNVPFTFVGHTHVPVVFGPDGLTTPQPEKPVVLADAGPWVLNPGSVGQPRDKNADASCAVFDTATREFTVHRCPYDITATQQKMRAARLPALLIERLSWGD